MSARLVLWHEDSDFHVGRCNWYEASCWYWYEIKRRAGVCGGVCDRFGDPDNMMTGVSGMMTGVSGMMPWGAGMMAGIKKARILGMKLRSV
ncbi:hypothetical protein Pmani_034357 [Petrolisthes manimaculis]|uniref:Uncharacterized protein n=1 Tax=Petrolisthes manimaculis TaxID=1843537 RepID=A0AAE1TPS5_9EUCA|nr:hypothetical protein Pmani_034357 [Petrolisthes manimaculis]